MLQYLKVVNSKNSLDQLPIQQIENRHDQLKIQSLRKRKLTQNEQFETPLQNNNDEDNNSNTSTQTYNDAYIALCLIAKQEHKFIKEWVTYHNYIGVKKFYIYDHGSSPPMQSLIQNFIDSGLVQYQYITNQWQNDTYNLNRDNYWFNGVKQINSPQRWVHTDCFVQNREKHQFMAMIDIDEFIVLNQGGQQDQGQGQGQGYPQIQGQKLNQGQEQGAIQGQGQGQGAVQGQGQGYLPVENPDLPTFLKEFEDDGGLIVYWRIYGSSGFQNTPEKGGVLGSYTNCQTKLIKGTTWTDIKHIVNTKYMGDVFCVIHGCLTTKPSVTADHKVKNIQHNKVEPYWGRININHYMVKSWEDFQAKRERGGGHSPLKVYMSWRNKRFFDRTNAMATGNCSFMKTVAEKCCQ